MAVTVTSIFQGPDTSINDVIATADADAAAVIPHGLAAAPAEVQFRPLILAGTVKTWAASAAGVDATNVNCVMGVAVGGGNAAAQQRITAKRPHTIGR